MWLAVALVPATSAAMDGRYRLELAGAALTTKPVGSKAQAADGEDDLPDGQGTVLLLDCKGGRWQPAVAGLEPLTRGTIRSAAQDGSQWRIVIDAMLEGLPRRRDWLSKSIPVLAEYDLVFGVKEGRVAGQWKRTIDGQTRQGNLSGEAKTLGAGSTEGAPKVGERPRFLLRRDELPALRAKAQTPWGRAMLARLEEPGWSRSGMAVAQGLLYQLTGERKHADKARDLIDADIRSGWWKAIGPIHDPAHKATEAMIAWDLIHDACGEPYNARMRGFLADQMRSMFDYAEINSGNGHPNSNWSAQYRAAVGMIAMALLADAGTLPQPPGEWDFEKVSPPADFQATDGMPVLPLADAPLRKWLYSGPLNIGLEYDGLESLGGAAAARPVNGTTFKVKVKEKERQDLVSGKYPQAILFKNAKPRPPNKSVLGDDLQPPTRDITATFGPVPASAVIASNEYIERGIGGPGMIHLWRAAGLKSFQTLYFYSVLDNPVPQHLQVRLTSGNGDWYYHNSCLWISGRRFGHGDALFLDKGKHPAIRQVTIGTIAEAHGRHHLYDEVWLRPLDDATVARGRLVRNAEARFARQCIQNVKPHFEAMGRPDADAMLWLALSRAYMEQYATQAIGDRGWHSAGQCYTQHPMLVAQPFAHALARATGEQLDGASHLGWFLAQAAARTVFSDQWARMQDYGRGGGPVGADLFGRGFANVPADARQQTLWGWQRTLDLTDRKLLNAPEGAVESLDPMSAAFTFVNWPGAGPQTVPTDSSKFPRAIVDTRRLGYTFRNRWQDGNDVVAAFTGFAHRGGDWGCEGAKLDVRLMGLGAEWAVRGNGHIGEFTSTVAVAGAREPDDVKQVHLAAAPDGSGVVSLSYSLGAAGSGLRTFGVDYSQASGAPALIALADRLRLAPPPKGAPKSSVSPEDKLLAGAAGPAAQWRWVTDVENQVTIEKDGFAVSSGGGATLRAFFAAPGKPQVKVVEVSHKIEINYRYDHQLREFKRRMISVSGQDLFHVVLVMARGAIPAATIQGAGPNAQVTIGKQVVRFNEGKAAFATLVASQEKP
jgi:hypothetical protein